MYLHSKLDKFDGKINIAFIGCGKFISMFLAQYNQLKKINIDTIIDLDLDRAKSNCLKSCLLYTSPSPRDATLSRMASSA